MGVIPCSGLNVHSLSCTYASFFSAITATTLRPTLGLRVKYGQLVVVSPCRVLISNFHEPRCRPLDRSGETHETVGASPIALDMVA